MFQIECGLFIKFTIRRCELLPPEDVLPYLLGRVLFMILYCQALMGIQIEYVFVHLIIHSHLNRPHLRLTHRQ